MKYHYKKHIDCKKHRQLQYSVVIPLLYKIIKETSVNELLSDEKYEGYRQILKLIELISDYDELCDVLVDKEFGGNDSERCLYDYLVSLLVQIEFYNTTSGSQRCSELLQMMSELVEHVESRLQKGQYVVITYENESDNNTNNTNNKSTVNL